MKNKENNYAFIDSQNLHKGILSCGWKLDFKRFRIYLEEKYGVTKAFLFIGYLRGNEYMYTNFQKMGYIVVHKPTLETTDGEIKGNCDAELVLHCMIEYENFDKAIIVSGDGDFHCLVNHLLENNKLLKVGVPVKKKYSALLRRFGNFHFYIDKLSKKLAYKKRGI
ncbi:MAG: NYN domain-containing protein [Chlamydiia bacterium]|nr:NYN domain-containing protein [Chlamydiia bacterium]